MGGRKMPKEPEAPPAAVEPNARPWEQSGDAYRTLRCSFCEKAQTEVKRLIVGPSPRPVFICDECVDVCLDILAEDMARPRTPSPEKGAP